ncbi:MAG: hypothetical protein ABIA77_01165 [Candidatus Omnitrophota bacterium]
MKINVKKTWISAYTLITENPVILFPTLIIGFLELFCLELIYFFPRPPLMYIMNPIVKKLFGEVYVHYPGNMLMSMRMIRGAQMFIYVAFGVFLYAVTINMVKTITEGKTLKLKAQAKNTLKRYVSCMILGALLIAVFYLERKLCMPLFQKGILFLKGFAHGILIKYNPYVLSAALFVTNIVITVLIIPVLPFMILGKLPLAKAFLKGIYFGIRGFFGIFTLILLPYIVYLPMLVLKSFPVALMGKTAPEILPVMLALDIVVALAVECFVIVSVSLCVLDTQKDKKI